MTPKQKEIVIGLLKQAGYVEEKLWWINYKAKSMLTKVDLFGDEDNEKIVQAHYWDELIMDVWAGQPPDKLKAKYTITKNKTQQ